MGGDIPHREGRRILGMVDITAEEEGTHEKQPPCLQALSQGGSLHLFKKKKNREE